MSCELNVMVRSNLPSAVDGLRGRPGLGEYSAEPARRNRNPENETAGVGCRPHSFDFVDFRSARCFIHFADLPPLGSLTAD
ncbi:hypothetical protein Rmet_6569 [Cupriavidus metallidurans CH34]|uniref:Uncharacterized protein n=1 Tax=Cupriavidus metallidurans (strain ATCC 43123 / DSM 2839 / NBRC 102507 / CH34) TaxID=266264 RepID=D3DY02_CUPMC|nr:hypothetical protein Rmet_6569 [Cupriavidus metallidurans CH34]